MLEFSIVQLARCNHEQGLCDNILGVVERHGVQDCREFVNFALERYCTVPVATSPATSNVQIEETGTHQGHRSDPDTHPLFVVLFPAENEVTWPEDHGEVACRF